jgi:hypothetical protein
MTEKVLHQRFKTAEIMLSEMEERGGDNKNEKKGEETQAQPTRMPKLFNR